ncbi:MAG: sigma-70 family RNA polymerase sigma factor [Marmoricola sp.]
MDADDSGPADEFGLIDRARAGDTGAWAELYELHAAPARRFAVRLAGAADADDLVATAFERTFDLLNRGGGPIFGFRAYLLTTVRNAFIDHVRADKRFVWTEDHEHLGGLGAVADPAVAMVESSVLAQAFATLPERWRAVLWQSVVEGDSLDALAERHGLTKNAVAALTFRAREGLRQAYLAEHVERAADPECREVRSSIPAFHREQLSARAAERVQHHLDRCYECAEVMEDLTVMMSRPARKARRQGEAPRG